jgi:hypothetical protein
VKKTIFTMTGNTGAIVMEIMLKKIKI